MLRKVLYGIAFALAAAGLANASTPVAPCLNCAYTAIYNKAVSKGAGSWMIWNAVNGEIHKWTVTCAIQPIVAGAPAPDGTNGVEQIQTVCTGQETAVTQEYHDSAANLSVIYVQTAGSFHPGITVPGDSWHFLGLPPGDVGSAYDFVTNANYRAQLEDKLDESALDFAIGSPIVAPMAYIFAHTDAVLGFSTGLVMVVTVIYPDGSSLKIDIHIDGTSPYYEPRSARDSTGQVIPDSDASTNAGSWQYNGAERAPRDRLFSTMQQLGFQFLGSLPPDYNVITCTWDAANNRLSCIVSN
jgi:hypothetical protein